MTWGWLDLFLINDGAHPYFFSSFDFLEGLFISIKLFSTEFLLRLGPSFNLFNYLTFLTKGTGLNVERMLLFDKFWAILLFIFLD